MANEKARPPSDSADTRASIFKIRTFLQTMPDEFLFDSDFRTVIEMALGEPVGMNTFFRSALAENYMISSGEKFKTFRCKRPKKLLIEKLKTILKTIKGTNK